jgi:hypothetical protein
VSSEGYVPYGWQFSNEKVAIYTRKGYKMNIFGLISRNNACSWASTEQTINSEFVMQHLDHLSFQINKQTFVVLDNASIHQSKLMQERAAVWQERGLYLFFAYLLPSSQHSRNNVENIKNQRDKPRRLHGRR